MRWLGELRTEGKLLFRIGREGDLLVAEWPGLATLKAARDGTAIRFEAEPGVSPIVSEKIRKGLAGALVRSIHGELGLHASAVANEEGAFAFLGPSGSGKSTTAAYLANEGDSFLADDIAWIRRVGVTWHVVPTEAHAFLDEASVHELRVAGDVSQDGKHRVAQGRAARHEMPLRVLFVLGFSDHHEPVARRLRPPEAMGYLIPQIVRFVLDEPAVFRGEFEKLGLMLENVPVVLFLRRKDWTTLPSLRAWIRAFSGEQT